MKMFSIALCTAALALAGCNDEAAMRAAAQPEAKKITDGTLMTPGTPKLGSMPGAVKIADRVLPVEWNMWWGENGKRWTVYVDGVEVSSGELSVASPKAQQGKVEVELEHEGQHEIKVALCNDHGCTESSPVEVLVTAG